MEGKKSWICVKKAKKFFLNYDTLLIISKYVECFLQLRSVCVHYHLQINNGLHQIRIFQGPRLRLGSVYAKMLQLDYVLKSFHTRPKPIYQLIKRNTCCYCKNYCEMSIYHTNVCIICCLKHFCLVCRRKRKYSKYNRCLSCGLKGLYFSPATFKLPLGVSTIE